jgi:hypothetical protein
MNHWRARTYFSVSDDAEVCRISGFDERGQEHWAQIPVEKGFSDRRREVVLLIQDAIESGHEAGPVDLAVQKG